MEQSITYATKAWTDVREVLERHKKADLVIGNNLGFRFVDIGETADPYYSPELEAVKQCKTKYILWYAGDVVPPETDWVKDAVPLLGKYPIVTCMESRAVAPKRVDGNFETYYFSDQCYLSKTEYMRNIDYDTTHKIAEDYPEHGGNSFERRVAQFLSNRGTPMLVLADHRYKHITKEEK